MLGRRAVASPSIGAAELTLLSTCATEPQRQTQRRLRRNWSKYTITMIKTPVITRCQKEFTFSRLAPLLIVLISIAPSSGPGTLPTAPNKLVPPITEEAIDWSSQPSPVPAIATPIRDVVRMPANAAKVADST